MDNIAEALALLRLANNPSAAVATEHEFERLRRLATPPHAINAVLQSALAMRRTPARDVETWTPAI